MSRVRLDNPRIRTGFYDGPGVQVAGQQTGGERRIVINGNVVAGGTAQGTANPLVDGYTRVTGATAGGAAVILPVVGPDIGMICIVVNDATAAQSLPVFPQSGSSINALAANASYSIATGKLAMFIAETSTLWVTLPNVAS